MDIFAVIADPTRRAMLDMMANGERPAGDFVAAFPAVSQPAISQHLKVLRNGGMVEVRAERQRRFYRLKADALDIVRDWLAGFAARPTVKIPPMRKKAPEPKPVPVPQSVTLDLFG